MTRFHTFLSVVLILPVFCEQQFCIEYVKVKSGDSCWSLTESAKSSVENLKTLNPGLNCDALWVGQQICISTSSTRPKCTKTYTVSNGDYCYKVWTENELSEQQFMNMNPSIDCDKLTIGQELCVSVDPKFSTKLLTTTIPTTTTQTTSSATRTPKIGTNETNPDHPPLPLVEGNQQCFEFTTVENGDTCFQISNAYNLNLTQIRKEYDCDKLKIGDTLCVARNHTCQLRHLIKQGDSCYSIGRTYKLNATEIESLNEDLKCDKLPVGRRICVWPVYERLLANMTCKISNTLENDASCYDISFRGLLPIDEFRFLNPDLDCDKSIKKGSTVCIAGESTANCSAIRNVPVNLTCGEMAQSFSMSHNLQMKLNPTLNCDKLEFTEQVCIGTGFFKPTECTDFVRISPGFDTCTQVMNSSELTMEQLSRLNPNINCLSEKLEWGSLVCVTSLGMDTRTAQEIVISKLKSIEPELGTKFEDYLKNPNEENAVLMNQLMTSAIQKPAVNSELKKLYGVDENFRTIIDNQHPLPRQTYCDRARNSATTEAIKSCYCGNEELLVYCQALAVQRFQENEMRSRNESISTRTKRAVGCSFIFPGKGDNILEKMTSVGSSCIGGDCTVPLGFVEIAIESKICLPVLTITKEVIEFCNSEDNDCNSANPDELDALKVLADRSVSGSVKMCAIGSSVVRALKSADAGLCWDIVTADYHGFVGKLKIGTSLQFLVFKLGGGAVIKVHELPFPQMCKREQLECEDYCKWQDWDKGRAYGYIEMSIFAVFGFDGFKVLDEEINAPRALGCQKGEEAAVVLRIDRTCKNLDDRRVWRCCWSGDDNKCTFELMEYDKGFSFGPWGRTLFVCEFIDRDLENGQKLGFDVYGGKSKNRGKKSFYYLVKNDGIYFGETKYQENQLIKAWDNPCKGEEEEPQETEESEPNGQSSVPAAGCGKRIVGYYTGWGDREITENQLNKLTHVVFAFVAMYGDGSVRFGPVSEDDSGPEAGVKAKRRFLDMRDKARKVNSGVHILFAVGGWDNSQYFASVAADSGKRSNFINSVVDFIVEHKIDGVDLDWEYPDIKGADKNNHVTLVRELRERFDQLQQEKNRNSKYLITLASAAGEWNLREGYDLNGILKYADFINVMTYDYYGAWRSKWGAYTGPPAPLYFGSLKGFSGKLNADFTMKFYTCKTKKPSQLNMGVPFYGRFWKNVQEPINSTDDMWRTAQEVNGIFEGGYVAWRNLEREGWNKGAASWHDKTKTPYILNSGARMFMGFENERSLKEKISYATDNNLGGIMIWALDLDDDADTLLNLVSSAGLCSGGNGDIVKHTCVPIDDVRWWTPENSDETRQGECGKSAPLINGFYPVCDPDDPGFSCCGAAGYCGSGEEYCDCKGCKNYRKDPKLIVEEPVKPTRPIQWYTQNAPEGKRGRCGKDIPKIDGKMAICNPDDDFKHCCSNGGYCGTGKEYCECDGCVDYRKQKS